MKLTLATLFGALVLGSLSSILQAEEARTDPAGAMKYTFPGSSYTTMGIPLLRPPLFSDVIAGGTATTVTLSHASNLVENIPANTPCYLEVVGTSQSEETPSNLGDRFEVDVAATRASASNVLTIVADSPLNTAAGDLGDLQGMRVVIRPHWTLATVFGTGVDATHLNSSSSFTSADQVHFWMGEGFSVFWFRQNSSGLSREWRSVFTGIQNQDNAIIPPGVGVFVKRSGPTELALTIAGEVRTNTFVQPIGQGTRLLATGFPVDMSPLQSGFSAGSGFASSTFVGTADQIWTWTGSGVSTYWYRQNSSGTAKEWRNAWTGLTDHTASSFLNPFQGFFVKTLTEVAPVEVAKPYSD